MDNNTSTGVTSMSRKIALIHFQDDDNKGYEYLLPEGVGEVTHAVIMSSPRASNSTGMKVLKIRAVKDLLDKDYHGDLKPVVAAFNIGAYEFELNRQKRRLNIEKEINKRLESKGLLDKIRSMGLLDDPEISKMVEEYKNLA